MDKLVLDAISERMPWTIANRTLRAAEVPTSMGWKRTIEKLEKLDDAKTEEKLRELLEEHIICGEKYTKFYKVSDATKKNLIEWARNSEIKENPASANYPCLADITELSQWEEPQCLAAKRSNDDGIALVYSSEIKLTSREVISDDDEVFSDPTEIRKQYDEVIGLKYKSIQLFNIVWLSHHDNLIEVRTDAPKGLPSETSHEIHSRMRKMLLEALGGKGIESPQDLFPLIDALYTEPKEGTVVELGFTTSTGSVKLEKMRRTKTCLRDELYHIGGKKELGTKISPYRISVKWEWGDEVQQFQPELTLAGTSRGKASIAKDTKAPVVSAATINNCLGFVDYEFVRDKIVNHLKKIAKANEEAGGESTAAAAE